MMALILPIMKSVKKIILKRIYLQVIVNNCTKDISRVFKILSLGGYRIVQQNQFSRWMDSDTHKVEVGTVSVVQWTGFINWPTWPNACLPNFFPQKFVFVSSLTKRHKWHNIALRFQYINRDSIYKKKSEILLIIQI